MTAAIGFGRRRRHTADDGAADTIAIDSFQFVADDGEAARLQLVDVPEIAAAAVLFEAEDEQVVAASIDPRAGVAFGQQPYVAAVILRTMGFQQRDLQCARLGLQQLTRLGLLDEAMANECPARRFVTRPDPQRELIDHVRSTEIASRSSLGAPRATR